jgi:hypothetical protein
MRFSATTILVTALGYLSAATAHTIQLKAHSRECFYEALHRDDVMTVTFQVGDREFGGSGNLEIDFWVWHPSGVLVPLNSVAWWFLNGGLDGLNRMERGPYTIHHRSKRWKMNPI